MKSRSIIILVIILLIAFFLSAYIVDETEQVIITQFGRSIGDAKKVPGLKFKVPLIQKVNRFPKNLLAWNGDAGQIPTLDKTFIWVDTFARWKIVDPLKFFQTVNNVSGAYTNLDAIIDSAVRNLVTSYPLLETVRKSNRKLDTYEAGIEEGGGEVVFTDVTTGREKIVDSIMKQAQPKLDKFGIELVDVKIKRLNYVEEVQTLSLIHI